MTTSSPPSTSKLQTYLDVDGVINAQVPSPDWSDWKMTIVPTKLRGVGLVGLKLWTSEQMVKELTSLPLDIHWMTDWNHEANQVISPLVGLPTNLPVVTIFHALADWNDADPKMPRWWKARVIRNRLLMEDTPFAFLDDNIRCGDMGWNKKTGTVYGSRKPHLCLSMNHPHSHEGAQPKWGKNNGLRKADIDRLGEFCHKVGAK